MRCRKIIYLTEQSAKHELTRLKKEEKKVDKERAKSLYIYSCERCCNFFHIGHNLERRREEIAKKKANWRLSRERILVRRVVRPCRHISFETELEAHDFWDKCGRKGFFKVCPRCAKFRVFFPKLNWKERYKVTKRKRQLLKSRENYET